jgi:fatty acid desaturase
MRESLSRTSRPTADVPYKKGYSSPAALKEVIAEAHSTRLVRTFATAVFDHLSVPVALLAATSPSVREAGGLALAAALTMAVLVSARQLRALECLVHEASHYNWSRRHRTSGDVLATILAAVPTGVRIADYRASHLVHHRRFGTPADPDLQRYQELALEDLDRSGAVRYSIGVLRRFGAYHRSWLSTLGSAPVATCLPFPWCAVVITLPGWLLGGWAWALPAAAAWLVTHQLALPVLRFIGESSEHLYREADTVFEATVSNIGFVQRVLVHPHGDGFHTIHHMWSGVPHHQLARLHRTLLAQDEQYRGRIRYRTRVLEHPRVGLPRTGECPMNGGSAGHGRDAK